MSNHEIEQIGNIVEYSNDASFFYERGIQACNRHDYNRALLYLEHAISLDAMNDKAYLKLAQVLFQLGDNQRSFEVLYTMLYEQNMNHEDCYYLLAHNCFEIGKHFEARKYAEKYIKVAKTGRYLREAKAICECIVYDELTDEQEDDELPLLLDQASFFMQGRKIEKGIQVYKKIIRQFPTCWVAYNNLAIAYFHKHDMKAAFDTVETVLEKNPGNLHAMCNYLIFLHAAGQKEALNEQIQMLSGIHPFSPYQSFKLGSTLATVGEYDLAFKWLYSLYQKGYEGEFTFYYWLAYCAFMNDEMQLAKSVWKHVVMASESHEGKEPWSDLSEWAFQKPKSESLTQAEKEELLLNVFQRNIVESEKLTMFFYYTRLTDDTSICERLLPYVESEAIATILSGGGNQQKRVEDAFLVANKVFEQTKTEQMLAKNCIFLWFHLLVQLWPQGVWFENQNAWASALEYILRKQLGLPGTQAVIGEKYGIKPTILRKYVKIVKEFVE